MTKSFDFLNIISSSLGILSGLIILLFSLFYYLLALQVFTGLREVVIISILTSTLYFCVGAAFIVTSIFMFRKKDWTFIVLPIITGITIIWGVDQAFFSFRSLIITLIEVVLLALFIINSKLHWKKK